MRPSKVGDISRWIDSEGTQRFYLVTKIGPRGGCDGPCIYPAKHVTTSNLSKLRSTTWLVDPDKVPDHVNVALAVRALTGKGG